MQMKLKFLLLTLIFNFLAFSQNYSKCKIFTNSEGLTTLSNLGIPVDHGIYKQDSYFISDFSAREIEIMRQNNFQVEIMIADVTKFYQDRSKEKDLNRNTFCPQNTNPEPEVPTNFNLGSMAGFFTYSEFLAELDQMQQLYPDLITVKAAIDTFQTHEGRPVYWVRISDFANTDETEPEVLYSAIHHAREPASLSSTIFYMWYLLENYASNPEIQFLVNETEMYFVPMLNPDGYIENQTTEPSGGGMWRKNKRNNLDGTFGVDLNRNYDYEWGTTGISFDTSSDVFPGDSAFSEPETQAMKWFCANRDFLFAFNAHTYSNLMLFPIGATVAEFAVDHDYFQALGSNMVQYNGFIAQKSSALYPASGDSDDYMYKVDTIVKPKIFAYTPEIGSDADGFWPAESDIISLCQGMIYPNMVLAHATHNFWEVKDKEANSILSSSGDFNFSLKRLGLEAASVTVSITPIQNILTVGNPKTFNENVNVLINDSISYTLLSSIEVGDEIKYVLVSDFGSFIQRDTLTKIFGNPTLQFVDNAETNTNWTGDWATTTAEFYSPSSSITDSPLTDYSNNSLKVYALNQAVDLTHGTTAKIEFYAKWEIEDNFDYARLEVSTDGGSTWQGQCGKYTNPGVGGNGGVQPSGEPVYDGFQTEWVLEEISLSDYLGQVINIRFVMAADGGVREDGFYVDDFKLLYDVDNVGLEEKKTEISVYPNPVQNTLTLANDKGFSNTEIKILDVNGKVIQKQEINTNLKSFDLNVTDIQNGMYFVEMKQINGISRIKFFVLK